MNELMQSIPEFVETEIVSNELQFSAIHLNPDYRKKWNEHMKDFVYLTKGSTLVNNTLYRIGGLGRPDLKKDKYFMLLKYTEAQYGDSITKDPARKNHLEGKWCIIDRNGVEKYVADSYKSPWLIRNSCLFSVDQDYYNLETKEFYAHAESTMQSKEYLFIKTGYGTPKEKQGVMKIHKETGCWELFY